jgi:hypothetical protein
MPNFFVVFFEPSAPPNGQYQAIVGPNPDTSFTAADGADANGLAAIKSAKEGKFVAFNVTAAVPTVTTVQPVADSTASTF